MVQLINKQEEGGTEPCAAGSYDPAAGQHFTAQDEVVIGAFLSLLGPHIFTSSISQFSRKVLIKASQCTSKHFVLGSAPQVQSETAQTKCCAPTADCCVQDVSITRVVHVRRKGGNYLGALAETLLTFCLSAPCALFSHRNMLLTVYVTTHLAYIPGSQIGQVSRVLYITNKTGIRIAIVKVADHVGVACPYAKCVRCQSSALAQLVAGNWRGLGLRGS